MKAKNSEIPFGLPRVVVTAAYFLVICLTGMAIQAADPLQQMMKLNGAYSHIENEKERTSAIASVVGFGLSFAVLSGVFVGPVIDLIGAKFTGLLGLALHSLGYVFMFLTDVPILYYVAGVCFGTGYQFIQNCHLSAGCLFPRNSNLILTLLSAGADVSLFLPYAIFGFATNYGDGSAGVRKAIIQYLIVFITAAGLIDALLLPMKPYSSSSSTGDDSEKKPLLSEDPEAGSTEKVVQANKDTPALPKYWTMTLVQQLGTLDYWLFVVFLIFGFCRKKHFSIMIRPILAEMDSDPTHSTANFYADMYNQIVPAGFIPAILWGALVDRFGINSCMFASNILGTTFVALSLVPWLSLQVVTIGIYILYQCFIMGQALAFTASVYGFTTVATLQGICCSFIGVFSVLMDFFWPSFINHTLGSYRMAGFVWLVISAAMFIFPVILTLLANMRKGKEGLPSKSDDDLDAFENVLPPTQVFDRGSITMMRESQTRNRLGSA